jgi:signal transduction histidine kinase
MHRAHRWPFVLAGVLIAALILLGRMQVASIRSISETREQRERAELESAAKRFAAEIDIEISRLAGNFELREVNVNELAERYARWRATAADPRILGGIFIIDGTTLRRFDAAHNELRAADWPPQLARNPAAGFDANVPALLLPIRGKHDRPEGMLVLLIDAAYLERELMPDLARRFFPSGENGYDAAVARAGEIVYRSNPGWPASVAAADPDLVAPLLSMRRREREKAIREVEIERPPLWRLMVRHRGAPLAEVIAAARRRDIALALLVLFLLGAVAGILAMAVRRADRLRRQQLEFVAGITHELNTPLAALGAAGQNLADGVAGDPARYGEAIVKETRRLVDLVDQVLLFGGMQARAKTRSGATSMPRAAIDDALAECRWMAEERGVAVECDAAGDLPPVRGDAASLTRAVQNLVANAIRHGGEGRWVGVRAGREDGFVNIVVEDHGPGIPPADLPHLFKPFYRGRNAQTRGSGIGLTIVDRIARAHGGSVSVAKRRARGAAFTLRLPVAEERL